MPSVSKKQHNLMAMVANDPKAAKRTGIKQSVGQEFMEADKGRKFGTGGNVNYTYGGKGQINKQRTRGGSIYGVQKNLPNANLNKYVGKKEGGEVKHEDIKMDKKVAKKAIAMHDKQLHGGKKTNLSALKKGGVAKKMASGGLAAGHKSADGCATKGKTKARAVTMKKGGKC